MSWSNNKELLSGANAISWNSLFKKYIYIYIYISKLLFYFLFIFYSSSLSPSVYLSLSLSCFLSISSHINHPQNHNINSQQRQRTRSPPQKSNHKTHQNQITLAKIKSQNQPHLPNHHCPDPHSSNHRSHTRRNLAKINSQQRPMNQQNHKIRSTRQNQFDIVDCSLGIVPFKCFYLETNLFH